LLEIKLLKHQKQFVCSKAISTGLVAGYGSGKSYAATIKTILKKMQYPNIKVAYYLPTYPLIRDIAFDKFPEILEEIFGIEYKLNKSDKEIHTPWGTIVFRSMNDADSIVGYEVGYSLIDECDILPVDKMGAVYKKILARNRSILPNNEPNRLDVVGTPEGYKWFYDRFVNNLNNNDLLIKAKTYANKYLPGSYIEQLKEQYDEKLLKAYLDGEFVNLTTGNVYHAFGDDNVIDDIEIDPHLPLIITFDFNISPYNAIYLIQEKEGKTFVIDNAIAKNKPLRDPSGKGALELMIDKFKYLNNQLFSATVFGDASGQSRNSGTAGTNYSIIREYGFKHLRIKKANPRIEDRVNAVNSRLCNSLNKKMLCICKRNKELINDLRLLSYNDKGDVDKSNKLLSHDSDSIGYYIEYNYGLNKPIVGQV